MAKYLQLGLALLVGIGLSMMVVFSGAHAQPKQHGMDAPVNTRVDEVSLSSVVEPEQLPDGIWMTETVDSAGDVGLYTSLELDAEDYPHISYYDDTNGDLKYAYLDATGWHIEMVDSEGDVGKFTSLAIDQDGYPHISYYDSTNGFLKYAYQDAYGWHSEVADSVSGLWTSLALDSSGNPHISYRYGLEMVYSYRDVTGWHPDVVDQSGYACHYETAGTSLAIDDANHPHISYQYCNSICVPHPPFGCTYHDYADLRYAYYDGNEWYISEIDTSPVPQEFHWIGDDSSLRLDHNGAVHINYSYDMSLKYSSPTGMEIIDDGDVGKSSSLALDTYDQPYVSYYDYANGNLKFAYKETSGWQILTLDSAGNVGQFTSQELDANGNPVISYYDITNGDLKFARHLSMGISLLPRIQSKSGAKGETVSYQLELTNLTGVADGFSLEAGPHTWDTQIEPNPVGPIPDGSSATVMVSVTVPIDAPWYQSETIEIIARSLNNPTLVSESTRLVTSAYAPPQISVYPQELTSINYHNEIDTQTLTIQNGLGVTMTYSVRNDIPGIVLLLHFDEFPGSTNFADLSGNGYNGYCTGFTCPNAGVPGKKGPALDFDGSDDYVETTSFPFGGPISISAWVYSHNIHASHARIIDFFDDIGINNLVLAWFEDTGRMIFSIFNDAHKMEILTEQVFPENQWVHVVAVVDEAGIGYLYWNGELVQSGMMQVPSKISRLHHYIGKSAWANDYYNGLIDELTLFDRALTDQEIQKLYLGNRGAADWLTFHPVSGTVSTNGSSPIQVTFNAHDLQPDNYTTTLTVESDDPLNPLVRIPVTMTVLYEGIKLKLGYLTGFGLPDSVVTYTVGLYNYTSLTDTYSLEYGGNVWQTSLSGTVIGPLTPNSSQIFTASVTIPPDAGWYQTDTVVVTATSMTSPTEFLASAQMTTQVYAPPQISVSPAALSRTQYMGEVTTQALTIANGFGVTLTYETISSSPWLRVDPVSGEVPTNSSIPIWVTFNATGMQPGVYTTTLYLTSNDPLNSLVRLPVTMTVTLPTPVTPTAIILNGPEIGLATHPYTFTADIIPISTTLPIQYAWQATGQASFNHTGGVSDTAAFTWELPGTQIITVTASNSYGTVVDTHTITITDESIAGLTASNDSPTNLGTPTTLHATLEAGSNVTYTWDFGDGIGGNGAVVAHIYPAIGVYTATVTASNHANQASTSTVVTVVKANTVTTILSDLPNPSLPGQPFTVTFSVTSAWGTSTGAVTITVSEGDANCTGELVDGSGSCTLAIARPGEYTLEAVYSGDDNHLSSHAAGAHSVSAIHIYLPVTVK